MSYPSVSRALPSGGNRFQTYPAADDKVLSALARVLDMHTGAITGSSSFAGYTCELNKFPVDICASCSRGSRYEIDVDVDVSAGEDHARKRDSCPANGRDRTYRGEREYFQGSNRPAMRARSCRLTSQSLSHERTFGCSTTSGRASCISRS